MRILLCVILAVASAAYASEPVEIPVVDVPYNVQHGLRGPSMQQSLAMTGAFYELSHEAVWNAFAKRDWVSKIAVALFDVATKLILPLTFMVAWVLGEWHSALLGMRGPMRVD